MSSIKQFYCTAIFVLLHISLTAQTESHQIDANAYVEVILKTDTGTNSTLSAISSVRVIDARDDTSALGFYSIGDAGKQWPKRYRILPSLQKGISNWFEKQTSAQKNIPGNDLLIVIKNFWLSAEATPVVLENGKKGQPNMGFSPGIVCNMEFYLQRDTVLYPLYKVDSLFSYDTNLPANAGDIAGKTLMAASKKLAFINFDEIASKRKSLKMAEIEWRIKTKTFPVQTTTVLKKGVYRSFEEFKTNAPSVNEYELRQGKMGDVLYVKENNTEYPERNAWGFCDGENIFINSGDYYSKLVKRQNTFYFFGIKALQRKAVHDVMYTSFLTWQLIPGENTAAFLKCLNTTNWICKAGKYIKTCIIFSENTKS